MAIGARLMQGQRAALIITTGDERRGDHRCNQKESLFKFINAVITLIPKLSSFLPSCVSLPDGEGEYPSKVC